MLQGIPPIPPIPPTPPSVAIASGDPPVMAIVLVILVGIAAVTLLVLPVVRAWARRLEDGAPRDDSDSQLGARVEHLEQRLADAEERLDFAERMLARGPEPAVLPREKAD